MFLIQQQLQSLYNKIQGKTTVSPQNSEKKIIALIGDIGGTNLRFAIISFTSTSQSFETIKKFTYQSSDFTSVQQCIEVFLKDVPAENYPSLARIGTAGAVFDNKNTISNLKSWPVVDGNALGQYFKIPSFKIYNDFEIASYGVIKMDKKYLKQINSAKGFDDKPKSVLGAGTGLGVSFIGTYNTENEDGTVSTQYNVFPGEGGHASFPQTTNEQQEFFNFLKTKYPEKGNQIGLEYGLVGPAIPYFYEFLKQKYPLLQQMSQVNIEEEIDSKRFQSFKDFPRKEVFNYGKQKKDKLCEKVVQFFIELYAQAIGDICLRTLCYGGVYLCGGISISLAEYILENKDNFMKDYIEKREYLKSVFEKIPIYIVMQEDIGLEGAFVLAQQDFNKQK